MTTLIANKDVRTIAAGIAVSRAAATLPQTATSAIYTVSGGRILVVALVGEVTVALGATVTSLGLGVTPTVGSAANTLLANSTAVTSAGVGTHYIANPGGAPGLDTATQAGAAIETARFLVPAGSITWTTTASDTGQMKWDLVYIPFDAGAQVVAA